MAVWGVGAPGDRVSRAVVAMGWMNSDGWKLKLGGRWNVGLAAYDPAGEGVCVVQE